MFTDDPFVQPPTSVVLSDTTAPPDAIDALFIGPFLAGDQPVALARTLDHVKPDATFAPDGAVEVRSSQSKQRTVVLMRGNGWTLHRSRWGDRSVHLRVTATDSALAGRVLDEASRDAVDPPPEDDDVASIGFWSLGRYGGDRRGQRIAIRPWDDIAANYGDSVGAAFGRLMALTPGDVSGRLLLFHGPPGTGKTTALRALAHAWRDWCDLEYVLDPDALLNRPGYLMEVASGDDEDRWRLIVLEDCDELIRGDAKSGSGQSLSRLLNLTDGILGQGLRVLVAITTNEPLARLHPAIVRPGRCLAQVQVGRLTPAECRRWLGETVLVPAEGLTLAELLARSSNTGPIEAVETTHAVNGYL